MATSLIFTPTKMITLQASSWELPYSSFVPPNVSAPHLQSSFSFSATSPFFVSEAQGFEQVWRACLFGSPFCELFLSLPSSLPRPRTAALCAALQSGCPGRGSSLKFAYCLLRLPDWIGSRFPLCFIPSHSCLDRKAILVYMQYLPPPRRCAISPEDRISHTSF